METDEPLKKYLEDDILSDWLENPVAYGAFDYDGLMIGFVEGFLEEWNNRYRISNICVFETDGVFYIYFSGKPETGYTIKYAYKLGNEIQDILQAIENAWECGYYYENHKEEIDKAIKFFEENGTLMTSNKDLKFIENRGATLVQQAMETN